MARRGRKLAEDPTVTATTENTILSPAVTDPSPFLTSVEQEHWRRVIEARPPDWFTPETHALLKQYVRHEALADWLALQRQSATTMREISEISALEARQSAALCTLATKMGLSRQASKSGREEDRRGLVDTPWA